MNVMQISHLTPLVLTRHVTVRLGLVEGTA